MHEFNVQCITILVPCSVKPKGTTCIVFVDVCLRQFPDDNLNIFKQIYQHKVEANAFYWSTWLDFHHMTKFVVQIQKQYLSIGMYVSNKLTVQTFNIVLNYLWYDCQKVSDKFSLLTKSIGQDLITDKKYQTSFHYWQKVSNKISLLTNSTYWLYWYISTFIANPITLFEGIEIPSLSYG